jgi:phosphoribosylamine--glycine ligase
MKILVIGSGGREHALVKHFAEAASVTKVFASPGNPGMKSQADLVTMNVRDHRQVVQFCNSQKIDFVFIGPEEPLVDGLADTLRNNQIRAIGPSKNAAQLEGSKIFAKKFMQDGNVKTADAVIVSSVDETLAAAETHQAPYVLKADGLAAGKGVFICKNLNELKVAAEDLFVHQKLGEAGQTALLEKNLAGHELSYLVLTNGFAFQTLPLAQDHKRLFDDNLGPNTGGMGTVAPLKISEQLNTQIIKKIIEPSIEQLKKEKMVFRGILFVGVMVVNNEPYALEYNVRFGDPETQVILPLIENDLGRLFFRLANGELDSIITKDMNAFCIVNAAPGYPDQVQKNVPLELPANENEAYILQAGTRELNGQLVSSGGRVLNIVALDSDFEKARMKAYELNDKIKFDGRQFRTDLGDYQFQRNDT